MFAMTLSALLLGAAAEPSVAAARAEKPELADHLCRRLECTSDQLASIRKVVADTRLKIAAERADDREAIARMKIEHRKDDMTRAEHARLKAAMKTEKMELDRVVWAGINHITDVLDREQAAEFGRFVEKRGPMFVFRMHGRGDAKPKVAREHARRRADGDHGRSLEAREGKLAKADRKAAKSERTAEKSERKSAKSDRKADKAERRIDRKAAAKNFAASRHPAKA
jgi:hypothetical protein